MFTDVEWWAFYRSYRTVWFQKMQVVELMECKGKTKLVRSPQHAYFGKGREKKKKKWRSALKSYRRVDISMCVPSYSSRLTAFHRISIFSLFTYLFYFLFTSSTHFLSGITPQITLNSALFFAQRTKARRYKHPGSTYYVG